MSLPATVSHYRILKKIGEGGMGAVYLADDLLLERQVAIKILAADLAADAERVARFRREAKAISALNHPNIVTIHDYGEENGLHFFVTEFLGHRTLRDLMRTRRQVQDVLTLGLEIARGLAAAHAAGVIHRDIKPENVMIAGRSVKLVDFGLAKRELSALAVDADVHTRAGLVMGTFPYMSPEQVRGEEIDDRSDVFSLGIVLYEWLTGRRPFGGATAADLFASILTSEPARLSTAHVPQRLETVLFDMLSKNSAARPDASSLVREMESILSSLTATGERSVIASEQLATDVAQAMQGAPARNNLPVEATPLVGREREVESVIGLLQRSDVRLLTVTGAAGTGKTRIALAAGQRLAGAFRDGVFFVALDAIRQPELVASSIAQTVGVREQRGRSIASSLNDELRNKRALLLLDNFEQLLDAAATIATLVASAPEIKVLITSQAPLRIRNEHEFAVDPLPAPPEHASLDELQQSPAVELFVRRAEQVKPDFALNATNAWAVAEICRRLEGVPLAIELAAVRAKLLSPEAILARMADPLSFLSGGPRDLPKRQQALRDAVDWSVGLLSEQERSLFARLSIFHGGWGLAAAEKVCRSADAEVVEALASLVDKSLVRSVGGDEIDPRFAMLLVTRSFARQLLSAQEATLLRGRHLDYFTTLAEEAEGGFSSPTQSYWLQRFDADQNNFRAAIEFASSSGHFEEKLRMASSLWKFWNLRGQFAEGRQVLDGVLRDVGQESTRLDLVTRALVGAGVLAAAQGDFNGARAHFERNLELCRQADDQWGIANSLNNLAVVAVQHGDLAEARSLHEQVVQRWRALGNRPAVALSLQNLGNLARMLGDLSATKNYYDQSLQIFRDLHDDRGVALSLQHLASVEREGGHLHRSRELYDQALLMFMNVADHWQVANCMAEFAECVRAAGDRAEARELLDESLLIFHQLGDRKQCAYLLEALSLLEAEDDCGERALMLSAAAVSIRKTLGATRTAEEQRRLENALIPIRERLGTAATSIWQEGEGMSFDQALEFAHREPL
jgi:non-specific serine/threonine protein kinase